MRRLLLMLAAIAAVNAKSSPAQGLSDAAAARSMLGADVWSRVVRIDNSNPSGFFSRGAYPKVVYATVFEMSGVLWFYTDTDGTQSLSLTSGTSGRDERDPGPLFLAIDRGFKSWQWVDEARLPRRPLSAPPPNACFVQSVAALLGRLSMGAEAEQPRLLSYYVATPNGLLGHTVLLFGTGGGLAAVDSDTSAKPVRLPPGLGSDIRAISAYLRGGPVSGARVIPVTGPRDGHFPDRWASMPAGQGAAG